MLVKAKRDVQAYGPITRLKEGHLYIVYAVEDVNGKVEYSVFPASPSGNKDRHEDRESDPLFFPSEEFEIVADRVTPLWISQTLPTGQGPVKYTSFPEWFENNFWIRAHDWNLEGDDYKVIQKYKRQYENLYEDYL